MGFTGSFVVCRTALALDELAALNERADDLDLQQNYRDDWKVGEYLGSDVFDDVEALLVDVAEISGFPALSGYVNDSDCVLLNGFASTAGRWAGYLDREQTKELLGVDDSGLDERFGAPDEIARKMVAWALESGLKPDGGALLTLLADAESDPFAEDLFKALLKALGLRR